MKNATIKKMDGVPRDEWLEMRRTGIGGSGAAGILGVSPWSSPFDVYAEIVLGHQIEESKDMKRGNLFEPVVVQMFEEAEGLATTPSVFARNKKHEWLIGTPDRLVVSGPGEEAPIAGLEAKTAHFFAADGFGEPGTDEVPEHYLLQCAHYMAVTGLDLWYLAVLIGMDDFRVYIIKRDAQLEAYLLEALEAFWTKHIIPKIEPNIFESKAIMEHLAKRYPRDVQPLRKPTLPEEGWVDSLRHAEFLAAASSEYLEKCKARIKNIIADATGLDLGDGNKITWKKSSDGKKTDWKALALELGATTEDVTRHSETKAGSRRFLMPRKWKAVPDGGNYSLDEISQLRTIPLLGGADEAGVEGGAPKALDAGPPDPGRADGNNKESQTS